MSRKWLMVLLLTVGLAMPMMAANAQPWDDKVINVAGRVVDVQRGGCWDDWNQSGYFCQDLILVEYYTPNRYLMSSWIETQTYGHGARRPWVDDILICEIDAVDYELCSVRDWYQPNYYFDLYYNPWPRHHRFFIYGFPFYRYPVWINHHPRWRHDHPGWYRDYRDHPRGGSGMHPRPGMTPPRNGPPVRFKTPRDGHPSSPGPIHVRPGDRPRLQPMPARPAYPDRDVRRSGERSAPPDMGRGRSRGTTPSSDFRPAPSDRPRVDRSPGPVVRPGRSDGSRPPAQAPARDRGSARSSPEVRQRVEQRTPPPASAPRQSGDKSGRSTEDRPHQKR